MRALISWAVYFLPSISVVQLVADVALDRPDGPVDVCHGLTLGDLTDQHLAVLGEGNDGRGGPRALGVGDDGGLAALEDGDDGVGRPEVDADRTCHGVRPPLETVSECPQSSPATSVPVK